MENIKELLSKIRSKLNFPDDVEKDAAKEIAKEVLGIVASVEVAANDLTDNLKAVNSEAKVKKLKIRELEGKLDDLQTKLDDYAGDSGIEKLKEENENLKKFKTQIFDNYKKELSETLEKISGDEKFKTVSKFLKLPEPSEGGKFDLSKMTEEDLSFNRSKINEYKELGYFGDGAGEKQETDGRVNNRTPDKFEKKIDEAKTFEELEALQDEI